MQNLTSEELTLVSQLDSHLQQYVWPALLALGALLCLAAALVLCCALHTATESFLLALLLSSLLCLVCEAARRLETHLGYSQPFQYAHGYLVAAHDWFWFTSCWLLIVMTWERLLGQCRQRRRRALAAASLCRPLQAGIAAVLVYCLCFVAALPQFWEWEVKSHVDPDTGASRLSSVPSKLTRNSYYVRIYFWFKESVTTFVPLPMMLLQLVLLCCTRAADEDKASDPTHPSLLGAQNRGSVLHRPRPPLAGTGLYVSQLLCYLLLTGPWKAFVLVEHLKQGIYERGNTASLFALIREALRLWFHLFFVIQLFILLVHLAAFRRSCCCRSRTCCRCCDPDRPPPSSAAQPPATQNGDMLLSTRRDYSD